MNGPAKEVFPAHPETRAASVVETLQMFSHDIRAAMSDVIGGLRLVDLDRLDPETRVQIDRVRAAGDTLAALLDAALMTAEGDALVKNDHAKVSLRPWLESLKGRWSGRARELQIGFHVEISDPIPEVILAPQVILDRILGNLIGNAMRHAQGASVTLRARSDSGKGCDLSVVDEGPGYPVSVLECLQMGEEPKAMGSRAGSGLGLRIAAELSRQIGGTLALSNVSGAGGGQAQLHLPEPLLDWSAMPEAPCVPPDLGGLRILVAEDNLTNQTILRQLLSKMNADAEFVADGVAALDRLEADRFDLGLIDIEMPLKSGLDVMQAVRARSDEVAAMPLVALTAYVLRDNREAIYASGADGIIGKPISSGAEFGRAILRYAGRATNLPEPEEVLENAGASVRDLVGLDHARFDELMEVAGPDGRDELLCRLREDLVRVQEALDAGVAARSVPDIRSQTHILIAISGAVGAERLSQLAEVLNIAAKRRRLDDLEALYVPCRSDLSDLLSHVDATATAFGTPPT